MKRLALLLLFAPVLSQAAVKVEAQARCGEEVTKQTFELTDEQNSFFIENDCGTRTTVTLKHELPEGVEFAVQVNKEQTRDKEAVVSEAVLMNAPYGEVVKFHCESCVIDAELQLVVSPVEVVSAE